MGGTLAAWDGSSGRPHIVSLLKRHVQERFPELLPCSLDAFLDEAEGLVPDALACAERSIHTPEGAGDFAEAFMEERQEHQEDSVEVDSPAADGLRRIVRRYVTLAEVDPEE